MDKYQTFEYDVVVIGAGGAGLRAAIESSANGAKTLDVSTLIRELKRESSKWIKDEFLHLAEFYWQNGYGTFSVSPSHVDALIEYIMNQVEHHRRETFQDEFRRMYKKYGVAIDERYVWD
jgi:shikimate 5-dehydrogenase